ncbi:2-oxo acid dehydrogenase subunit E2 [Haloplanus aerogenes]|uniref:2-oxo acid dehydrogenase subunit E2 n=1 Tax=Haloplanus aerogenes TaxID=660522 RepID=UPI0037438CD4
MADDAGTDGPAPRTLREERTPSPMRKTIANRLQESYREAVHVTVSREVDAEALVAAADDAGVSLTDVLLRALSDALAAHPAFNATFEDGTHRLYEEHNVGVAVAIEDGLVAPVVADVGGRSLDGIAAERERLTEAVQSGDYAMADLRGGTFTVSNLGPLDVDGFTPIINPPQIAILGVNRVQERARRDEDDVIFRRTLPLDLSFDHRVVDGADAARFLGTLAEGIESAGEYVDEG